MSEQIKISHALRVLSRITRMKEDEFICDFTIKVGGKSFPTHRTVLAASSDYFEALFSSKMKEAIEGFVEMKGLGIKGVQRSLEFMYTGTAQITLESVDDILHAADLFQLDGLKTLCFQYLTQNLTPSNCLVVANLAQKYDRQDIRKESERVIISNFKLVISSDMFPSITRSDLLTYVSKVDHETSWQAAVTWAKDKDEFPQLFDAMDIQKFPFNFLWETVLAEPLVKQSESTKNKVIKGLFSDPEELRDNLALENCILFKTLARDHKIADATVKVITQFMEESFEDLTSQTSFNDMSRDDLLSLLQSPATECSSETVKWEAALKWVKHDLRQRKKAFSDIFSLIKLEKLTSTYLRKHVRSEALVKESRKCSDILMDIFMAKSEEMEGRLEQATAKSQPTKIEASRSSSDSSKDISELELGAVSLPTVMDVPDVHEERVSIDHGDSLMVEDKQPPGQMSYKKLRSRLPGTMYPWTYEITYKFSEGSLNGVHYASREFKAYLPYIYGLDDLLEEAFNAGQVFKLRYKTGDKTGEIVWGDIPFKTNIAGGPDNNGYPDPGYLKRLHEALHAKGFSTLVLDNIFR